MNGVCANSCHARDLACATARAATSANANAKAQCHSKTQRSKRHCALAAGGLAAGGADVGVGSGPSGDPQAAALLSAAPVSRLHWWRTLPAQPAIRDGTESRAARLGPAAAQLAAAQHARAGRDARARRRPPRVLPANTATEYSRAVFQAGKSSLLTCTYPVCGLIPSPFKSPLMSIVGMGKCSVSWTLLRCWKRD
eukprot:scaffold93716_cov67-Phaeocystis_antarctica.AAC.2